MTQTILHDVGAPRAEGVDHVVQRCLRCGVIVAEAGPNIVTTEPGAAPHWWPEGAVTQWANSFAVGEAGDAYECTPPSDEWPERSEYDG